MRKADPGSVASCILAPVRRSPTRARAFTLIELLVVIAIIVLLVSILMPTLTLTRELARRATCGSRVRGLTLGVLLYAEDWREELPSDAWHPTKPWIDWAIRMSPHMKETLTPYTGGREMLECPNLYGMAWDPSLGPLHPSFLGYTYWGGKDHLATRQAGMPLGLSDPPDLILLSDMNVRCKYGFADRWVVTPHTRSGAVRGPSTDSVYLVRPAVRTDSWGMGGEGGNVARLDGSVAWRDAPQMTERFTDSWRTFPCYR